MVSQQIARKIPMGFKMQLNFVSSPTLILFLCIFCMNILFTSPLATIYVALFVLSYSNDISLHYFEY